MGFTFGAEMKGEVELIDQPSKKIKEVDKMSGEKKEIIYANLERDINGQLFIKGSLAKLDALKSIRSAQEYVKEMSEILVPKG